MNQNIFNALNEKLIIRLDEGEYSDMLFLVNTIERYKIKVDEILNEFDTPFGKIEIVDFNHLIYIILTLAAKRFKQQNQELFHRYSCEYFVCGKYSKSRICFRDEEVQKVFEKF